MWAYYIPLEKNVKQNKTGKAAAFPVVGSTYLMDFMAWGLPSWKAPIC
jgi:hypothetical protein